MQQGLLAGVVAGAAGSVALNMTTYLDMTLRGRPSSSMPSNVVEQLTSKIGVSLGGDGDSDKTQARRSGLGALLGYVNGLGLGALYGAVNGDGEMAPGTGGVALGVAAMAGSDVPAAALGVTDPRKWSASSWVSDIVPHLVYGLVTALTYDAITGGRR